MWGAHDILGCDPIRWRDMERAHRELADCFWNGVGALTIVFLALLAVAL